MRTFLAFTMILCLLGGAYLLQGPAFFWPDRRDPSHGILLQGPASQLLGAGLLTVALLGAMAARQASKGSGRAAPGDWQRRYFMLMVLALGLIGSAFLNGEPGPNPESRPPESRPQRTHAPDGLSAQPEHDR
ncbi:MAG: hypothetical protein RBT55_08210 [Rhodocyclaceae bacterium]|jgi:hypothetical protein|nr:hypothetical protein [Rhodocyclaceae bacterium]